MRKQLHIISTGKQSKEELIERAISVQPYIDYLHLREKSWQAMDVVEVIEALNEKGFPKEKIIVNDRVDVAQVTGIHQVQLAYHSLHIRAVRTHFPKLRISASVHSVEEAIEKEQLGAEKVIFGHVFETLSKQNVPPRGLDTLTKLVSAINIPVIAIGGISPDKVHSVLHTGAEGLAVLSGVLLADNPVDAAKRFREKLDSWKGG